MNSYPRIAIDREGRPWLAFRHRQEAIWGNNAVMVVGAVWIEHATTLSGSALVASAPADPQRRPARQPAGAGPARRGADSGLLQHRRPPPPRGPETTPRAKPEVFTPTRGLPPRSSTSTSRSRRLVPPGPFEEPRLTEPHDPWRSRSRSSTPTKPRTCDAIRAYRIEAGGKTYRPAARRVPPPYRDLRRRRRRRLARRHVALRDRRRRSRLDRQRRPRQRRRQGIHLVADPEDDRPLQPARRRSRRCSPTSGASPIRTATAT